MNSSFGSAAASSLRPPHDLLLILVLSLLLVSFFAQAEPRITSENRARNIISTAIDKNDYFYLKLAID